MKQIWIAFEYNHQERRWESSRTFRKVYQTVGHVKGALANNGHILWEIDIELPDLIECEQVHYIANKALGYDEFRRVRLERHVATGPRLIFIEMSNKINGSFPKAPVLPEIEDAI